MAKNRATFIAAGRPAFVPSAHPVSRFYCHYRLLSEQLISFLSVGNEMDIFKTIQDLFEIIPLLHSVLETAGVGLFGTRRGQDGRTRGRRLRTL